MFVSCVSLPLYAYRVSSIAGGYAGARGVLDCTRFHPGLPDRVHHQGVHALSNGVALCLGSDHFSVHVLPKGRVLLRDDAAAPKLLVQTAGG